LSGKYRPPKRFLRLTRRIQSCSGKPCASPALVAGATTEPQAETAADNAAGGFIGVEFGLAAQGAWASQPDPGLFDCEKIASAVDGARWTME